MMVMDSLYNQAVYVLLCIQQRLDLESISSELEIDLDLLEFLLKKLFIWGLVDVDKDSIVYTLTPEAKNIIKYTQRDSEKDTSPLIRIK